MDKKEVFYPIQIGFWMFSALDVVVGFAFEDGEGAVELFGEEEAYHLMGEGHLGDRKTAVGGFVGFGGESERPADHEHEVAHARIHLGLQKLGELRRAVFLAVLIQQNHAVRLLEPFAHLQKFFLLLLGHRHVPRVLQGRNHLAFIRNIMFEPLLKNGNAFLEVGLFRLAVL